ncbi:Ribosomal RNA large subunit methyltransferase I, related [Neospora caninum Liverpool]|uniref:Ribosomal RNA large subunit methyltransferase I, related n=1 Tax=Neospora caninum (strain Liverpool) TaxID=572307 RepID=F0VCL8_NEOCL|nr:Ribosomal RNA large subunit methyltransferase I, related [Neospora caninum Liverpool]CBZ51707.1 Ribosomal RNA large subunit methyltransferase I, related [Neospora caninum Liverpool]|eukprot:XP_003881740.1 Ribosomal RNA large subunit methyltransferase I, related [Neospora caninum Liverpool]
MSSSPRSPPTDLTRKPSSATDGRTERVGGVKGDGGKKSSAPRGALEPRGVLVLKTPAGTGNAVTGARACGPWIFSNQVLSCSLRDPAEKASQTCGSSQGSAAPSSAPGAGDEPGSSASTTETALVRVQDERGVSYGVAYYNRHALISARFLSEDADELIDHNFFLSRFRTALQSRMSFSRSFSWSMHGHSQRDTVDVCRSEFHGGDKATEVRDMFFRLVNGEGDGLPGLVVDLYGEYACIQSLTRGMDSLMPLATAALRSLLSLGGILVRRDRPDRALEFPHAEGAGDTDRSFAAWRSEPVVAEGVIPSHVVLAENGCAFAVDLRAQPETGKCWKKLQRAQWKIPRDIALNKKPVGALRRQCLAWYGAPPRWRFDRREFRRQVALLSAGKRVLDLSGHSAACGITCVHLGKADRCVVVDNNEQSAMLALKGMNLNGITSARLEVQQEDVDTWLKNYASRLVSDGDPCYFDVVILDLPNLAWRKSDVPGARASLRQLVETVARVTAPGGYLAITNSSRHYSQGTFLADASVACASAGRDAVLCAEGGAGFDFPVDVRLPRSPELQWTILELSER